MGLSPNFSTLFNNLPTGTKVWSGIKEFSSQTNAAKVIALIGKKAQEIKQNGNSSNRSVENSTLLKVVEILQQQLTQAQQQNELLQAILMKDPEIAVLLDGKAVGKGVYKHVDKFIKQDVHIKNKY
ncbi:hypothetical protein COA23_23165 [Priestia megaterium]|nr:hypothetical protein COA23_23165 [Priestia megaterium]